MFRLLYHYFGMDSCKSCQTLKDQLTIVNKEKEDLLSTILGLVKPEVIQQPTTVVGPAINKAIPWNVRKSMMEQASREEARLKKAHDSHVEELEKSLDLKEDAAEVK